MFLRNGVTVTSSKGDRAARLTAGSSRCLIRRRPAARQMESRLNDLGRTESVATAAEKESIHLECRGELPKQ
jgi:hypothetical protein